MPPDPEIRMSGVRSELLEFVCRSYLVDEHEVNLDESLLDQGIIDSFGLVELAAFIERRFKFKIADVDMNRENFGSVNKMAHFVENSVAINHG